MRFREIICVKNVVGCGYLDFLIFNFYFNFFFIQFLGNKCSFISLKKASIIK